MLKPPPVLPLAPGDHWHRLPVKNNVPGGPHRAAAAMVRRPLTRGCKHELGTRLFPSSPGQLCSAAGHTRPAPAVLAHTKDVALTVALPPG